MAPRKKQQPFASKPSPQNGSPLFNKLPAELRIMVLKTLLLRDEPIKYAGTQRSPSQNTKAPCLEMLRACQVLYFEGREVFHQNTVELEAHWGHCSFIMLDNNIWTRKVKVTKFGKSKIGNDIFKKFNKLQLHVVDPCCSASGNWPNLAAMYRDLRPYLYSKDVVLRFSEPRQPSMGNYSDSAISELDVLELLRCKSLRLLNFDGTPVARSRYARIANIVESDSKVIDLPARGEELQNHLKRSRLLAGVHWLHQGVWRENLKLKEASRLFRTPDFLAAYKVIRKRIEEFDAIATQKRIDLEIELQNINDGK